MKYSIIRPRMPEIINRLAASVSVLSPFSGHGRTVEDRGEARVKCERYEMVISDLLSAIIDFIYETRAKKDHSRGATNTPPADGKTHSRENQSTRVLRS